MSVGDIYKWDPASQITAIPHKDTAAGSLDEVPAMRANGCDHTIDVPEFCRCVLDGHIRANSDFRK